MDKALIKTQYLYNKNYINNSLGLSPKVKQDIIGILEQINNNNTLKKILEDKGNLKKEIITYSELEKILTHRVTIASVILTYNEERCITRCINSILQFSDEIIVIDSHSTDNTIDCVNKIKSKKIKTYEINWIDDFSFARNFGLERTNSEWVFFIDADEYMDPNYDVTAICKILSFLSLTLDTSKLIICPSIYDESSDNVINTVTRIFVNNKHICYYGKVHEELRCRNSDITPMILNLNIKMRHDGYLPEVLKNKDKLKRNLKILVEMIQEEPDNPRWQYFFCRESYYLNSSPDKLLCIEKILLDDILIDISKSLEINNILIHPYTFQMLDLLCRIKLSQKNYDDVIKVTSIMSILSPSNSDVIYYNHLSEMMKIKQKNSELLDSIVKYRKKHFEMQENVISSSGYHIDFLIAILLFENMEYEKSYTYFTFLKDKLYDESFKSLIKYYLEILASMKSQL